MKTDMGSMGKKMIDRMFKQVDSVVWDMLSGKVGFTTTDGVCSIELGTVTDPTEAPDAQVSVNPFDLFGMPVPAFAQSVPVDSIALGDMIYSSSSNKVLGWVVKKNDKSFKLMKQDGTRSDWVPPKVQMIGFDSGVMVLRSLVNMLPGGAGGLGQMQSMLPMMMMMGGDNADMGKMMPMLLMSQMGMGGAAPAVGANPMASMMPMMMMQMMGGNKGGTSNNFFGN